MIIELLLSMLFGIFKVLTSPINIPDLPADVEGYISTMFEYITAGAGILANYTPLSYLLGLFGAILAVDIGINLYHFVMWILRKIPMLGIE